MTYLPWSPDYSVGDAVLDDEHQRLFALVNRLHDSKTSEAPHEELKSVISDLREYVRTHFTVEEEFMRVHGYPGLEAHKRAHAEFAKKVEELGTLVESGQTTIMSSTLSFLKNWLTSHILKADREYIPFLKKT